MQDEDFREWLEIVDKRPLPQVRDNISRIKRVEDSLNLNLDTEYINEQCESVLNKLDLSNAEFLKTVNLPTDIAGLSSLKTAVRKYVKFCDQMKYNNK